MSLEGLSPSHLFSQQAGQVAVQNYLRVSYTSRMSEELDKK